MLKVQLPTYVDVSVDDATMQRIAASYIRSNLLGLSSGHKPFPDPIQVSKDGKQWVDPTGDDGFYSEQGGKPVGSVDDKHVTALVKALALIEKGEKVV
jgi:hypothetical protein